MGLTKGEGMLHRWRMPGFAAVTAVVVAVMCLSAAPALATGDTINLGVSANPTQNNPVAITASGSTSGATEDWVFVDTNASEGCAADPADEDSLSTTTAISYGNSVFGGSYTDAESYTPAAQQQYLVCAYIANSLFGTVTASTSTTFTATGPSASLSVTTPGTATQEVATSVSVSGTVQVSSELYVFVDGNASDGCADNAMDESDQSYTTLANGVAVGPGAFSHTFSYTPQNANDSYIICGYVTSGYFSVPYATSNATFTTSLPGASVSINAPGSATQNIPITVGVSGSAQVASELYVYVDAHASDGCADDPIDESDQSYSTLAYGVPVGPGSFSESYSYTPGTTNDNYIICAYVTQSAFGTPQAVTQSTFSTSNPSASVSVTASANPTAGLPVTLTVSGSAQVAEYMWAYLDTSSKDKCATDPLDEDDQATTLLASNVPVGPGSFTHAYSYTPSQAGNAYEVCAYVGPDSVTKSLAATSITFTPATPGASVTLNAPGS